MLMKKIKLFTIADPENFWGIARMAALPIRRVENAFPHAGLNA
jgi:hypothetical protein